MKTILFAIITAVSVFSYAKGGGDQPMTEARFMHESLEYSMGLAAQGGAGTITATSVQKINAETMNVSLTNSNGQVFNFQCILVDDFSKGGTVVKKDVRCQAI